jgi:hypothetical protein
MPAILCVTLKELMVIKEKPKRQQFLRNKENTSSGTHRERPAAEGLSSVERRRPIVALIW